MPIDISQNRILPIQSLGGKSNFVDPAFIVIKVSLAGIVWECIQTSLGGFLEDL